MTSGGQGVTGSGRRVWLIGCGVIAMFVVLHAVVNSTSLIDELAREGSPRPRWMPWTWEISSALAWVATMPLIALAALRLRPPRLSWPGTIAAHLAVSIAVSLLHVGLMVSLRHLVHGLMGDAYRFGPDLLSALVYEWRKDAVSYLTLAIVFAIIDWLAHRADGAAPVTPAGASEPRRLEVRDGSRTTWLAPDDILWAEAAGNYVELHTSAGTLLHRTTLAGLERELAPFGFARIHRSRLVRRAAVRAIETNASGDFELLFGDGTRVGGSRRYRANLQ